jgi:membrane-associated phospholipid phosphatase
MPVFPLKILFPVIVLFLLLKPVIAESQTSQSQDSSLDVPAEQNPASEKLPGLFTGLWRNTWHSFAGWDLALHTAGIASTYLIMESDLDYYVHSLFHDNSQLEPGFWPMALIGGIGPVVLPASVWVSGKFKNSSELKTAGWALAQSGMLSLSYVTLLKALTGRPYPDWAHHEDMRALSREWRFGFLRGGVFWGWPSGHAITTTSLVSTLTHYYPEKWWLKITGYTYVMYTLVGVCVVHKSSMHWFSDGVAGTLMGYAIGSTVGKNFRKAYNSSITDKSAANIQIIPILAPGYSGAKVVLNF